MSEGIYPVVEIKADWSKKPSNWHTGTPAEIGFYLVTTSYENYFVRFFNGVNFYRHPRALKIIAWQKIEPYRGN